jgi:mono/diheme cytochrome c family protein
LFSAMELLRDRSIAVRAKDVQVPPLGDQTLVASGAEDYAAMCAACHLAPGVERSEIRVGLYPQPPDLTKHIGATPAEQFWVVKHGIKMSAMPAWGKTHDDQSIWGIVAFLQKLPGLTPEQYRTLVGPQYDHDHADHHHAGAVESGDHATGHGHHHDDAAPAQVPQR